MISFTLLFLLRSKVDQNAFVIITMKRKPFERLAMKILREHLEGSPKVAMKSVETDEEPPRQRLQSPDSGATRCETAGDTSERGFPVNKNTITDRGSTATHSMLEV